MSTPVKETITVAELKEKLFQSLMGKAHALGQSTRIHPIETAPKNRPILAWCEHKRFWDGVDPVKEHQHPYDLWCSEGSRMENGWAIVEWREGDGEFSWWDATVYNLSVAANPVVWMNVDLSNPLEKDNEPA